MYEIVCTAVADRADLFAVSMDSLLRHADLPPSRIIVHEDVRPGTEAGEIGGWLENCGVPYLHKTTRPAAGLGPALLWSFRSSLTPIVFYTQDDWEIVRPIPLRATLLLMRDHGLNHVRFNKRATMVAKGQVPNLWHKQEYVIGGQVLTTADHWYSQPSLWRIAPVFPGIEAEAHRYPQAHQFVSRVNHWMNVQYAGVTVGMSEPGGCVLAPERHTKMKTYIWGPIGEPPFCRHIGGPRSTRPAKK